MKIPLVTAALRHEQTVMWEWLDDMPLPTQAAKRACLGRVLEEALAPVLKAQRFVTDGRSAVCPDLLLPSGDFGEVKAVTKEAVIFKHRLEKDLALVKQTGRQLYYFYAFHDVRFGEVKTCGEMGRALLAGVKGVGVVDVELLRLALHLARPARLHYRAFDDEPVEAYRFHSRIIRCLSTYTWTPLAVRLLWRGVRSEPVPVHCPPSLGVFQPSIGVFEP